MGKAATLATQLIMQRIETIEALRGLDGDHLSRKNQDGQTMRSLVRKMHDHEMSHTVHITKTRQALGLLPTEVQMILTQAMQARAALAAALIGLSDEDLERKPSPDQWSIGEVVEHMLKYDPIFTERINTQFGEG